MKSDKIQNRTLVTFAVFILLCGTILAVLSEDLLGGLITFGTDALLAFTAIGLVWNSAKKSGEDFDGGGFVILSFVVIYYIWRLIVNAHDNYAFHERSDTKFLDKLRFYLPPVLYEIKLVISIIALFIIIIFHNAEEK